MPHLLATDNGESSRSRSRQRARTEVSEHRSMWDRLSLQKIGSWLKRDDDNADGPPAKPQPPADESNKENGRPHSSGEHTTASRAAALMNRRSSRRVVPGLPRPLTFRRMNSEKRDKLLEVPLEGAHRRAASADRRGSATTTTRHLSPSPVAAPSVSAPDVLPPPHGDGDVGSDGDGQPLAWFTPAALSAFTPTIGGGPDSNIPAGARQVDYDRENGEAVDDDPMSAAGPPLLDLADAFSEHASHRSGSDVDDLRLQEELEAKWILNLSMHFRDMSDREKFFVTFAEEPTKWRRVTVSCDYRQLEPDSLEADLKTLHYQRDKSSRIYEAIRDSLLDIQFYDTVTNLKLQTSDGRLHVHVTEDVNEIIPYPSVSAIDHLECKHFRENAVSFDSHISGFVYKVSVNNRAYIKKEIPGPDAVEEFLYEINALSSLQDSNSVIKFEGIIVDEQNSLIKGLLISYAEQGALVDMIYDHKSSSQLHWKRREKWARQIVQGLSEIHEAGFVQGDFTLSNIVIDHNDNAKIIDINRRGCPVGWEPPELAKLIESGQRISIYIGVKSDLYQLGMVLWALAEQEDEPERQDRPLVRRLSRRDADVPEYFKDIIRACLSETPRGRPSASNLLARFPNHDLMQDPKTKVASRESVSTHRSDKEYIDPATAVNLEDISQHRRHSRNKSSFENIHVASTEYPASSGSYIIPDNHAERGRSPDPLKNRGRNSRSDCSPYAGHRSVMSLDDSELENELASYPASRETRWEQVYVDGDTKLVQRGCGEIDVHNFAAQELKDICVTTPPGEVENSSLVSKTSDSTPLNLLTVTKLHPIEPQVTQSDLHNAQANTHHRGVGSKASFSDRVHQLAHASPIDTSHHHSRHSHIPDSTVLADLELELEMDSSISSSAAPSRVSTGFSTFHCSEHHTARANTGISIAQGHHIPLHQDSGFAEPERASYESERLSHRLDESIKDPKTLKEEEARVSERPWDEKHGDIFGEGLRGAELEIHPKSTPVCTAPIALLEPMTQATTLTDSSLVSSVGPFKVLRAIDIREKAVEEKISSTTIRPPSILIPDFHHGIPKSLGSLNTGLSMSISETDIPPIIESQHPYYDIEPAYPTRNPHDETESTSDDISDYLSHSISYSQHSDSSPSCYHSDKQKAL